MLSATLCAGSGSAPPGGAVPSSPSEDAGRLRPLFLAAYSALSARSKNDCRPVLAHPGVRYPR